MSQRDWFRNKTWNAEIENAFFKKLARAKDKAQYLRIQASTIAADHPEIALRLIEQYFALGEHFDIAQAHVARASAHLSLRRIDLAVQDYEAALSREVTHPHLKTQAYLQLPLLIAKERLSQHYDRAVSLLEAHKSGLMFPVDRFVWNCALALIRSEQGDRGAAREAASRAQAAASETHSGFRHHAKAGLVQSTEELLLKRLEELAGGRIR